MELKCKVIAAAYEKMKKYFPTFSLPSVKPPSKSWIFKFNQRQNMKVGIGTPIEKVRSETATVGNISWWYDNVMPELKYEECVDTFIFNADETMIKQNAKKVVIVPKSVKRPLIKSDDSTEHVTIMTCVAANGDVMTPLFIFPLKTLPKELDEHILAERLTFSGQPEGWIDRKIFIEWIKSFVEWVKLRRTKFKLPNQKAVLFVDAHSSREAPEALKLLKDNNIACVTYPPDSTHILQALDVGIFGPFKTYLSSIRERNEDKKINWIGEDYVTSDQAVRRVKLVLSAVDALRQATTVTNIQSAFAKSGIYPLKKEKALANPSIGNANEVTINVHTPKKRKKISIASKVITSQSVMDELEKVQKEAEEERYASFHIIFHFGLIIFEIFIDRRRFKRQPNPRPLPIHQPLL